MKSALTSYVLTLVIVIPIRGSVAGPVWIAQGVRLRFRG